MLVLETERLFLRHFHILDSEAVFHTFGDAEVMRFGNGVQTKEWVQGWLRSCLEQYHVTWGFGPYAVMERLENTVIGYCGLFYFPDLNGQSEVEIGYRLKRTKWGQVYATEVATVVRDYTFGALGINRLIALIDPANKASVKVAQKLDMRYEKEVMFEDYSHPDQVYVITDNQSRKRPFLRPVSLEKIEVL
jgi:hypothetical protein